MSRFVLAMVVVAVIPCGALVGCASSKAEPAGVPDVVNAPAPPPAEDPPEEERRRTDPAPSSEASEAGAGPAEDPPEPRLVLERDVSENLVLGRLIRSRELLAGLEGRPLLPEQVRQREIGAGLLREAESALEQGDVLRADILSEKALYLIEDLASSSD